MRSMEYSRKYKTPEGFDDLVMCGDGEVLTGLWFEGSRDDWRDPARRICRGFGIIAPKQSGRRGEP